MGTARVEDPLGKVGFFTKLAEAVPMESGVFCRSDGITLISIRIVDSKFMRDMSYNSAYMHLVHYL